jgi:hypothetical protein
MIPKTGKTTFSQHYRFTLYNFYFNHMLEISCLSCVLSAFQRLYFWMKICSHSSQTRLTLGKLISSSRLGHLTKILIYDNFMMTDNCQIRAYNGIVI